MEPEILYICEKMQKNISKTFIQSPLHTHDHPELSIILSGEAHYTLPDSSSTLKAGQLILFQPHVLHSVSIPSQTDYHDLHIGISHLLGAVSENTALFPYGFLIIDFRDSMSDLYKICKQLGEEWSQIKPDSKLMLQALILQLLVLITRKLDSKEHINPNPFSPLGYPDKHKVVELITHYINENYMHEISLEMFAKDMYLSQVYISKIFKEETGHSPIHYLIKRRLAKAKEILENEHLPVKLVSNQVGYGDVYHFSKLFKKYYGYPPSKAKSGQQNKNT